MTSPKNSQKFAKTVTGALGNQQVKQYYEKNTNKGGNKQTLPKVRKRE